MKAEVLQNALLSAVKERIPQGTNIANVLMDILFIGKEAVYRRLRGEVSFTLSEAGSIAKALGISLDVIIGSNTQKSRPFQMKLVEYAKPTEIDYAMLQNYVDILRISRDDPYSELATAANTFPQCLYLRYELITKFYHFKWLYHNQYSLVRSFEELTIIDRMRRIQMESLIEHRNLKTSCFIFDNMITQYLINDIKYFVGVRLISEESVKLLKEELHLFLNELEEIAATARYDNGNNVYFYVSNINFDSTYTYVRLQNYRISLIEAFILNAAASLDEENYEKVKTWVLSLRRLSTLISQSGELQRMQFFKKQRDIVDSL